MKTSPALDAAIQAIAKHQGTGEDADLIAAKCRALMIGYDAHWRNAGWTTLCTEEVYHLPLINPETSAKSRTFTHAGKFDGVVEMNGHSYLLEHKTTSEDVADPNAPYWRRLAIDSQVSAYSLAKWQQGEKLTGTLYDVISKPSIRPKNIAKAELTGILHTRRYCGFDVPLDIQNAIVVDGQSKECTRLYEMRLANDTLENPNRYFQRRTIPRLDSDITEYAGELWDVSQSIIHARAKNSHYKNSAACMTYGTPCTFLGICSGYDTPESDRWVQLGNVHQELVQLGDNGGRDVLTNSRVTTFQTCRRKHYLKYELGIKRRDDDESEALIFGALLHEALRAWWDCFRRNTDVHSSTRVAAVNEVAATASRQQELPV